jgi:hypothetical protein
MKAYFALHGVSEFDESPLCMGVSEFVESPLCMVFQNLMKAHFA